MSALVVENSQASRIFAFLSAVDQEFCPPLSVRVNLEKYSEKLADAAANYFIVSAGTDIGHVAFYCNDYHSRTAFISSIAVRSGYRGDGAADLLLKKVFEVCVNKQMAVLRLQVDSRNSKAVGFYSKHGFHIVADGIMERSVSNLSISGMGT